MSQKTDALCRNMHSSLQVDKKLMSQSAPKIATKERYIIKSNI